MISSLQSLLVENLSACLQVVVRDSFTVRSCNLVHPEEEVSLGSSLFAILIPPEDEI